MTDAITREEKLLAGVAIEPITREEMFLAKLAGQDVQTPEPITRKEILLSKAIENGGDGGSVDSYFDTFFDLYQQNGERRNYAYAFAGVGWNDITFKPKYPIIVGKDNTLAHGIFAYSHITTLKNVEADISASTYPAGLFSYCPYLLDVLPLTLGQYANTNYLSGMYRNSPLIETIEIYEITKNIQFSQTFTGCSGLKNLIVTGTIGQSLSLLQSSLLTNESIQNVIDCLVDLTGGTAKTLTLHTDVKAKLTETQIATITGKNWTLA